MTNNNATYTKAFSNGQKFTVNHESLATLEQGRRLNDEIIMFGLQSVFTARFSGLANVV